MSISAGAATLIAPVPAGLKLRSAIPSVNRALRDLNNPLDMAAAVIKFDLSFSKAAEDWEEFFS